jgi:sortase A
MNIKVSRQFKLVLCIILLFVVQIFLINVTSKDKNNDILNNSINKTSNTNDVLSNDNSANYIKIESKLPNKPLLYKTTDDVLSKAVGIMEHSVMFGKQGQTLLSGHRETFFKELEKVKNDDIIKIFFNNKEYKYRVYKIYNIKANEGYLVYDNKMSNNELVLITCYPFNSSIKDPEKRYIIKALII